MRYFIAFLVTIGLIIIIIVMLFGGGSSDKAKVPKTSKPLASYASTDAVVRMVIDGPVNADKSHKQIQIDVNKDQVTYREISGYNNTVKTTRIYTSNSNAYDNFLQALTHAGFTQGSTDKTLADERGYCAQGKRYIFTLTQGGKTIERYWATSCTKPRTYLGALSSTIELFKAQVPDYATVSRPAHLN